jgi:hemoglobin
LVTGDHDPLESRPPTGSFYDRVGGEAWFLALIERFYDLVEKDPLLRPLYPDDLAEPRRHLAEFLVQRFGGPETYTATRGQPRLRMRHAPFAIGTPERDAWMEHMTEALRAGGLGAVDMEAMLRYFEDTATMLVNR